MKTRRLGLVLCAAILGLSAISAAAEFTVYPGARRDQQLEQGAKMGPHHEQGVDVEVYLTPDPFEKVYQFYKAIGTEDEKIVTMKKNGAPKPPNGAIQWTAFTFDGAKSISSSKVWAKIQRPTIAGDSVRDITSIELVRKK